MSALAQFFAYQLYRGLLAPLSRLLLRTFAPFLPEKIQLIVKEREATNWVPLLSSPIWIHASSGEIEYAKSITRELKRQYPEQPLLLTYFSPSAKRLFKDLEGVDHLMPLPWDITEDVQKFLNFFKPKMLLIARTDLWPTFLTETKKRNIPILLFSATYSKSQVQKRFLARWLLQWSLQQITDIFVVAKEDQTNLVSLVSEKKVTTAGDTRFDQVFYRLSLTTQILNKNFQPSSNEKVFIAGSTWPEDEAVLLQNFSKMLEDGWRLILVPHEIEISHLQKIESGLQSLSLDFCRYSQTESWKKNQILIVDQVGLLAELYQWGSLAFVGGSFRAKIHSVMEPLAAGLPVLVGPFHTNNREAVQFQEIKIENETPLVQKFSTASEMLELIYRSDFFNLSIKAEVQSRVRKHQGASQKVIEWVRKELPIKVKDF